MSLKEKLLDGISSDSNAPVGRYAPSPSGPLHLGNIQTALVAWLQIRLRQGKVYLRIDDLDSLRIKPSAIKPIIEDLQWLGFDWDGDPYYQTDHLLDYQTAFDRLQKQDQVYPCGCSRAEIRRLASDPYAPNGNILYPGTCRNQVFSIEAESKTLAWRFKVGKCEVAFEDLICGVVSQNLEHEVGDFILKRKDGLFAYQLATVVDDGLLGVTDVLRGEDLLDSTPRQIAIQQALGLVGQRYWHAPLKLDGEGEKLSKRNGSDSLLRLREQGLTSEHVIGKLSYDLGLIGENRPMSLPELKRTLLA
ncbi:MAG: glutamyl-tRNA synthetase [Neolewinella sp.]|jgi:glutamyl-tRNA synthetase